MKSRKREFRYDVSLSFAGEERPYVRRAASLLRARGMSIFFDEYEAVKMWGKDLYAHLADIYSNSARYCVLFISKHYARKVWTNHERRSAQARALKENLEYVLPARFDNTEIPGLLETISYVNLRGLSPAELVEMIVQKVGLSERSFYVPPDPDLLFQKMSANSLGRKSIIESQADVLVDGLKRMSIEERKIVSHIFLNGCIDGLPENTHVDLDLLRRVTGFPPSKILRLLSCLGSLGYHIKVRKARRRESELGRTEVVEIEYWSPISTGRSIYPETRLAYHIFNGAGKLLCRECAIA
jgi:hypothetical protein